jgi:hypothetical protein
MSSFGVSLITLPMACASFSPGGIMQTSFLDMESFLDIWALVSLHNISQSRRQTKVGLNSLISFR